METLSQLDPNPKLRLHFDELSHPTTASFLALIDCTKILSNAIKNILLHLYSTFKSSRVPPTRSVTVILQNMGGVAYTTGLELDDQHKEIHVSLGYFERFLKEPLRCRDEIIGVITHEMVHCYQWNALGTAPGGLIEGIADFVRLRAGLGPPHWKGPKGELGDRWDEGYQKTAYFLNWLETEYGHGTVGKINHALMAERYEEESFWTGIFGKNLDVGVLFKLYRDSLRDDGDADDGAVSDDVVLVELDDAEKRTFSGKYDITEDRSHIS